VKVANVPEETKETKEKVDIYLGQISKDGEDSKSAGILSTFQTLSAQIASGSFPL
jgi:hypothetical protein